jgi:hypothetical protein
MRYQWRLIQCFQGSFEKYHTIETREMTDSERDTAQKEQDKLDWSKAWVR